MSFKVVLPHVYRNFLSQEILDLKISETKATCDNCLRSRDQRFSYTYKENLKCCTFVPFIPNFAVGGILSENLDGAAIIKEMILQNRFNLPLGIFPDLDYQYRFTHKKKKDFGNEEDLLCHYYDKEKNRCTIWQFRGVVCTTFFCRSDYGKSGQNLWSDMKEYLSYVEMALAEDCLVMKDFSPRDISDQLVFLNKKDFNHLEKNKTYLTDAELKPFWNGYKDQIDFYISCYELVKKQNRRSFKEIIGEQGLKLEKNVIQAYACLSK
jgi:Fe-S-cluster containining protein